MNFPLQYPMTDTMKRNDLAIYANNTRESGPAMTWAMHTIGLLDLNNEIESAKMFKRSYEPYMRQPFKIWTEAQPPTLGAINFITGMGGFLQSLVSGYGGYRLFPEELVFKQPRLPPGTTGMRMIGLNYLDNVIDASLWNNKSITFHLRQASSTHPLEIVNGGSTVDFITIDSQVNFDTSGPNFSLIFRGKVATGCDVPYDKIGECGASTSSTTTPEPSTPTSPPPPNTGSGKQAASLLLLLFGSFLISFAPYFRI